MKVSKVVLSASLSASAMAFPGMKGNREAMAFHDQLVRRAHSGEQFNKRQVLAFPPGIQHSSNTGVGKQIKDCLSGATECQVPGPKTYVSPGALGSDACNADKCCVWDYVSQQLAIDFAQSDGQCNALARGAIRLGFHDAGAWSLSSGIGGADGSMLISDEVTRAENDGLQEIVAYGQGLMSKFNVGAADLVQMMANVATVVCPLAPRVFSFVGREDRATSPDDLLPGAFSSAETLLNLFADKTISAFDLAALVGAHSTSTQNFVDPAHAGSPQDVTPGVWDVLFYSETMNANFTGGITKFPSDVNLANDPATSGAFSQFADATTGQTKWNTAYARAYVRLSLLGVNNIDDLTDCTAVLPHEKNTGNPNLNKTSSAVTQSATSSASAISVSSGKPASSSAPVSVSSGAPASSAPAQSSSGPVVGPTVSSKGPAPSSSGKGPAPSSSKGEAPSSSYEGGNGGYGSPSSSANGGYGNGGYGSPSSSAKGYGSDPSKTTTPTGYVTKATATYGGQAPTTTCGHTGADGTWTTTVTSYYTKNGWHIPKTTVTCAEKDMPDWAKATASAGDLYQQWQKGLIGDGSNGGKYVANEGWVSTSPATTAKPIWDTAGSCIVKKVTVTETTTTTLW